MRRSPSPSVEAAKRKAYIAVLPVGGAVALMMWQLARDEGEIAAVDLFGLPLLALLAVGLAAGFLMKRSGFRLLEYPMVIAPAIYFFLNLLTKRAAEADGIATLAGVGYWLPALFTLSFMVFGVRFGAAFSLVLFALTVLAGTGELLRATEASTRDLITLLQTYSGNGLLILLLITLAIIIRLQAQYAVEMEVVANTDALTELSNRRHLEHLIEEERARASRYARSFSVILFDLDHFKRINDLHGHQVGDEVLKSVRKLLVGHIRQVDTLGRWGGEEFLLLVPEMPLEPSRLLAERLRTVIESHAFEKAEYLTASFGVAEYQPGDTVATLTKRVDEALYRAKAKGRNLVVVQES
jgi:diguanylate cyclase (GGDEF)-like protein